MSSLFLQCFFSFCDFITFIDFISWQNRSPASTVSYEQCVDWTAENVSLLQNIFICCSSESICLNMVWLSILVENRQSTYICLCIGFSVSHKQFFWATNLAVKDVLLKVCWAHMSPHSLPVDRVIFSLPNIPTNDSTAFLLYVCFT